MNEQARQVLSVDQDDARTEAARSLDCRLTERGRRDEDAFRGALQAQGAEEIPHGRGAN